MAKLVFHVQADYEEVIKLRNEIAKLKQELKGMDSTQSPAAFKALNTQLSASTQRMDELVNKAAQAGAVMEGDFRKKIFDASQTVNGFTEKIIAQKNAIASLQTSIRKNKELYRTITSRGNEDKGLLNHIREQEKALGKERDALFNLTQEQANARLSVKKLRDEYSLYKNYGKQVVETNQNIGLSLGKALGVIGGVAALKQLGSEIIRVRGEFQSMQTAIETMVGKDMAGQLIPQIKELAKISPLTMSDMVGAEKMMLGFNIQAEDTIKYLKAISDISMGESGKFNSLTLAFSQMSAAGKLMRQDLNQMINAGFNPLQIIAEKTGKSIATLKEEMSKGAVSAEMVQQAFIDATSAGGKFFGMSENASKTINGQISMMQDAWDNALNEIGKSSEGFIMSGIQATTSLIQNYETVGKVLVGLIATYGAYRTAVMLATVATSNHTIAEIALTNVKVLARKAQLALNAAMLTNPYVAITTVLAGYVATVWALHDSTTATESAQKSLTNTVNELIGREERHKSIIDDLINKASDDKKSINERNEAMKSLVLEYPSLIKKYIDEEGHLKNIAALKREIAELDSIKRTKALGGIANKNQEYVDFLKQVKMGNIDIHSDEKLLEKYKSLQQYALESYEGRSSLTIDELVDFYTQRGVGLQNKYNRSKTENKLSSFSEQFGKKPSKELDELLQSRQKLLKQFTDKIGYVYDSAIQDYVKKTDIETQITQIEGIQNGRKDIVQDESYWKKQKENTESVLKALSDVEAAGEKGAALKDKINEYNKKLEAFSTNTSKQENQAEKQKNAQEKYNLLLDKQKLDRIRAEEDLQMRVAQSKIDAMSDGFLKEQKQRDLNNKKEIQSIKRQKEDAIRTIIQAEKDKFDAQENLKTQQKKGYVKRIFDASTVDTSKVSSSWDVIIDNTSKKQQNDKIRQQEDAWNEYIIKYGTFTQKKEAIDRKYKQLIDESPDAGTAATFQKEWEEALTNLNLSKLKQEINWEMIFGDLSKVTKEQLRNIKKQLQEFKNSPEFQKATPEQIEVIESAFNSINNALIDKGGFFGGMVDSVTELKLATEELKKAEEELAEANKKGTEAQKEEAQKKVNAAKKKKQNAEVNVTKSSDKTIQHLTAVGDAIAQLGSSAEMSLSSFGNAAANIVDAFTEAGSKISGIVGAIFSILDGIQQQGFDKFVVNILENVAGATLSAGTFGLISKNESDKNLERDIEYLTQSNQDLKNALDNLSDKMDKASVLESNDIYHVQKYNLEKQEANTRELMQRSGAAHDDGFLGIGGSHSSNDKINKGISASEWERVSKIVGKSVFNASQFFQLSSKEMAKLAEEDTTLYSRIKDLANDGYKDAAQYMDEYITYYKQLEELENAHNQKLTNISFDSVRDEFKNTLLDMESDAEDFTANFEKMMRNTVVEDLMTKKYDPMIQEWYNDYAKTMEDGKIDKDEREYLRKRWKEISDEGLAERDNLFDSMGLNSSSSTSQQATKGTFQTMSQDKGDELSGRFTAFQDSNEEIKNQSIEQTSLLSSINEKMSLLTLTNEDLQRMSVDTPDIAGQARESMGSTYHPPVIINFPTDQIVSLASDVSSLKGVVDEIRTNQVDRFIGVIDVVDEVSKMSKNTPVMNRKLDDINDNIKKAL